MFELNSKRGDAEPKRRLGGALRFAPNFLTFVAVFCGLLALRLSGERHFLAAMAAIFVAALLDVADGFAARRLNAVSALGAELDSLADFLNFAVAPAMLLYQSSLTALGLAGWMIVAIYVAAGALRLARFNLLSKSRPANGKQNFHGLPSTAAAVGILLAIAAAGQTLAPGFQPLALAGTSLLLSVLMLSDIEFPALTTLMGLERKQP